VLCADDFAISRGVSNGIMMLAHAGRISATSCMVASSHWPVCADELKECSDGLDVGIHLTLTDQIPLGELPLTAPGNRLPSLGNLMKTSLIGRLALSEIRLEIQRQFNAFVAHFGRLPDFVDGHHHVHQFPGIRNIVVEEIIKNFSQKMPYLRICSAPANILFRRGVGIIRALGIGWFGDHLQNLAKLNGIPVTRGFSGVYDFSSGTPYGELFKRFLVGLTDQSLIMCHPGLVDDDLRKVDNLTNQRESELKYLMSQEFIYALEQSNVRLCRYQDC